MKITAEEKNEGCLKNRYNRKKQPFSNFKPEPKGL